MPKYVGVVNKLSILVFLVIANMSRTILQSLLALLNVHYISTSELRRITFIVTELLWQKFAIKTMSVQKYPSRVMN